MLEDSTACEIRESHPNSFVISELSSVNNHAWGICIRDEYVNVWIEFMQEDFHLLRAHSGLESELLHLCLTFVSSEECLGLMSMLNFIPMLYSNHPISSKKSIL